MSADTMEAEPMTVELSTAEQLAQDSIGALLRGHRDARRLVEKADIDRMIEKVILSQNDDFITSFRNEIATQCQQYSATNPIPAFCLEVCSHFYRFAGGEDFEKSKDAWINFLRKSYYVVQSEQYLGLPIFLKMLSGAVEKELFRQIDLEGDLLEHCASAYRNKGRLGSFKYEREALLELIHLLIARNKSSSDKREVIENVMNCIASEYASNSLEEGDYCEITQFLIQTLEYITEDARTALKLKLRNDSRITSNAVDLLHELEDYNDSKLQEEKKYLHNGVPPTKPAKERPTIEDVTAILETMGRKLAADPSEVVRDCHGD